ncbi:TRAM domain-containing protein [Candidatus Saccharibacteria bacterium]|nr:TRAM domain-containing protein [Candidatus Saccharibacteria bacterium]
METVTIDKLVPGGQGLGTLSSGKKAFVWGALPGETVEFEITKNKSSFCEGIATKILTKSERRSNPRDLCYLATSPWQIMNYDYELEQKSALVAECFHQNQIDLPEIKPTVTDLKEYFYRNKMEYSLYWNNDTNKIELAFHTRGTHRKLPITSSSIERSEVFQTAQRIVEQLNTEQKPARDFQSLLVRCNQQGIISSALFENHKPHPAMPLLTDTLLGHQYFYSPNGFFQINLPVYEMALKEIQKHTITLKVLDLYAGVGTIGLSVANNRELTLVEVNETTYMELCKNCGDAENLNPVLAKSEDVLDYITPDATVILDPPRAGCDPKLIEKIAQVKPPTIIYLSCNPITQARDLKPLLATYQIKLCQPFNFFPHTPHIENLIVLTI